jgi:hypothetical protein
MTRPLPAPFGRALVCATVLTIGVPLVGCSGAQDATGAGGSSGVAGSSGNAGEPGTGAGGSGPAGTTGAAGNPGAAGTTGVAGGGAAGSGGRGGGSAGRGGAGATGGSGSLPPFSFFLTSLAALRELSGSEDGFGGDLRFGETTGLAGADKICATIAEKSMPGSAAKQWRAFLSTVAGPVHAIDRVGQGPWYDRLGRLVASDLTQLRMQRPGDADPAIKNDLPNEDGVPNHNPDMTRNVDNHDTLTGTGTDGTLYMNSTAYTCNDWTSKEDVANMGPWVGHSWPAGSGMNWMSALREGGCAPGVNLQEMGGPQRGVYTVGTGGGYGGFYCFALTP